LTEPYNPAVVEWSNQIEIEQLVIEPSRLLEERPAGGPGSLYTALRRSTQVLGIVHSEPLPGGLQSAPGLERMSTEQAARREGREAC
jgi:hypothetical protein